MRLQREKVWYVVLARTVAKKQRQSAGMIHYRWDMYDEKSLAPSIYRGNLKVLDSG